VEITLSNGDLIRGDMIVSAVLRTDLVPVPVTLECTVRYTKELEPLLKEGAIVQAGFGAPELRIVWSSPDRGTLGKEQGGRALGSITFVALLDACADIAFRRSKAIIKENASLGAIYRACGARVVIDSDFPVERFSCFAGGVPSYHIAVALQEQAGALVWKSEAKKLKFVRMPDLFAGDPAVTMAGDDTEQIKSGFMERHEVPWFYSTGPDGAVVHGNRQKTRAAQFTPLKSTATLNNMTRALVHSRTMAGRLDMQLNAGDLIDVAGVRQVVVTAAHAIENGTDGSGVETYSRFWLATLET
jgi:hypothetical protein